MTITEFVALVAEVHGDIDLMVRGHPFTAEEIGDELDAADPEQAESIVLMKMLDAVR